MFHGSSCALENVSGTAVPEYKPGQMLVTGTLAILATVGLTTNVV